MVLYCYKDNKTSSGKLLYQSHALTKKAFGQDEAALCHEARPWGSRVSILSVAIASAIAEQ
jgi:hypothetical protein